MSCGHSFVAVLSIFFGLFKECFCRIREGALQGRETCFAHEEVAEVGCWLFGIEDEGALALFLQFRIIAPQMPVTGFDCPFFFELALTLADFQAVVDARCITDDQGRAVVGFGFFESFMNWFLSAPIAT